MDQIARICAFFRRVFSSNHLSQSEEVSDGCLELDIYDDPDSTWRPPKDIYEALQHLFTDSDKKLLMLVTFESPVPENKYFQPTEKDWDCLLNLQSPPH